MFCAAEAQADQRPLNPRIDNGLKLGSERSLLTTEIWLPVRQGEDRVLYGDIRLSGDDMDNFEGNLGIGYRQIAGNAVFGAHGWIDRRKTARGSTFNQATLGVEALGRDLDVRLNGYLPLSGSKTYATPNAGRADPYLAGSGVFYDTAGTLVEEPQGGFDIELGYRVPVFEDRIDAVRVYGGGYHFGGDETPDTTGWRTRVSADVTGWLQVGARFQRDSERGSQGFLEATLRFPGKASFRKDGLRARLDESPERDIDIVTGAEMTDTGLAKPVLNDSGDPQRVLHVDNTNSNGGDGTKDNPYATLKGAEAAMKAYDVIYVHQGDGGVTGQDLGIVIDKPHVQLIGSGVDLVVESNRVTGAAAGTTAGAVLQAATANPAITNTQIATGSTTGIGVLVTADNALVAGLRVQNANLDGVRVLSLGAASRIENAAVRNVSVMNNGAEGINFLAQNSGYIGQAMISDIVSSGNAREGVRIHTTTGGYMDYADVSRVQATGNRSNILVEVLNGSELGTVRISDSAVANATSFDGITVRSSASSTIHAFEIDNVSAAGNTRHGILVNPVTGGIIEQGRITNITADHNTQHGLSIELSGGAQIGDLAISDIEASLNTLDGTSVNIGGVNTGSRIDSLAAERLNYQSNRHNFIAQVNGGTSMGSLSVSDSVFMNSVTFDGFGVRSTGAGGVLGSVSLRDVDISGSTRYGVRIETDTGGEIQNAGLEDVTVTGSTVHGAYLRALTGGILSVSLEHVTSTGSTQNGVFVDDDTVGAFTADLGGGALGSAGNNRIFGNTGTDIRVDLDGGELKAENNWWGVGTGLAGGETTLDAASTIDAAPFLAADPGP